MGFHWKFINHTENLISMKKWKSSLFKAIAMSLLRYSCTNWTQKKNSIGATQVWYVWLWTYSGSHHHHYVVPLERISLTLSRHFSLSLIASGRSSGLHPVSSHSCWMYVRAGRPAFARPYVGSIGVHHLWARPCFSSSVLHVCPQNRISTATYFPSYRPSKSDKQNMLGTTGSVRTNICGILQ